MRVVGLQGSPRKKGNTSILLSTFLDEIEKQGGTVHNLDVTRMNVMPCQECGTCEKKGYCPLKDDMQSLYPLLWKADLVVLGTPIFFYGATAQLKGPIDRSQALWARKYSHNLTDPGRKWRRGVLLAVGATKGKNLFDGTELTARYFFDAVGAEFEGTLGYRQVEKAGDIKTHPTALDDARAKASDMANLFLKREKVLFVCRENACRSQMAAAFTRYMAGDRFEVESAGNEPADQINPVMEKVMAEKGIDMAYQKPMSFSGLHEKWKPDVVVSMGCEVQCPVFPGARVLNWDLPDPAEADEDVMRNIRDQVESLVSDFIASGKP